ncbi:MAG: M20/M25/M40 family metallo-hydrolase [Proteobacteria bacterium]|nr:M20/M25/M40 family metallo-hydrolase [Pseudomonadota bacterium]
MTPSELLTHLIRFDTSNPPGNEKACILWIKELLDKAGFATALFAKDPERPNLVARLKGQGQAPPLLLYGHVDVVPAREKGWTHPPFSGDTVGGFIWGRGALDMKGGIAIMLSALLSIAEQHLVPRGDIIFTALSDEEAGGDFGAGFMITHHPEQFSGVRYAIGEFGAFPFYVGKTCFYPIQTGEKQVCWMKGRLNGIGGHGSQRIRGGAMAKLGQILHRLDRKGLPVHITDIPKAMIEKIAEQMPLPGRFVIKQLLNPLLTNRVLSLLGERGSMFDPLLHHTINVTKIHAGDTVNVVPSHIDIEMDGRILPGFTAEDFIKELRGLTGPDLDIEITRHEPCPGAPDMGLFSMLSTILKEHHPGCIPIPMLLSGITDARYFSRLGIQTYGFLPMNLPRDFNFSALIHTVDERVPVACLDFGAGAMEDLILRYSG